MDENVKDVGSTTLQPLASTTIKKLVQHVLEYPKGYEWTVQGLGMMRTYLAPEIRLHVWDGKHKFPNVSELHTHPWNFHSIVVAGKVFNHRYVESGDGTQIMRQTIRCGEGGGLIGDPEKVRLTMGMKECYIEGDIYVQKAREIHRSSPLDGTVTIIHREFLDDTEHAYVYFDGEWVTAEPRAATPQEIEDTCVIALGTWFG